MKDTLKRIFYIPGGIYGILSVLLSIIIFSLSIAHFPGYDMVKYDVSVLGIGPGLSAPIFNIGLFFIGLLAIPFFLFLIEIFNLETNRSLQKKAKMLSISSCIALSLIGCFPVINIIIGIIHALLALVFFVNGSISLIIFSILMLKHNNFSKVMAYSGFIVVGLIVLYIIIRWSIIEWIVFFVLGFWIILIGIYTIYKKFKVI